MKQYLQATILALCTLFCFGFVQAQENAMPDGLTYLQNLVDQNADGIINGYTMPMRITGSKANSSIDIGIDTVLYVRNGENSGKVSFSAHAFLQIPFAIEDDKESTTIKFRGENLILAGEGTSIMHLEVGLPPIAILRDKMWLRVGQESYVRFTCDGVEAIGLQGEFIFAPDFLIPDSGNPADTVKATFNIEVADWDDLMFGVTFNRAFKIPGGGDFTFQVGGVVVDFSTQSNVSGFTFPAGYQTGFTSEDANLWTGFAIKEITVTPPQDIENLGESRPFTYKISDMLIDEWGLTGSFMAMRAPASSSGGSNSGLNLSIDTIGVSIMQNRINSGILGGSANVPLLKDKNTNEPLHLGISGQIQYDMAARQLLYRLSGTMLDGRTYGVPFAEQDKATVTLDRGCAFTAGTIGANGNFGATLLLNGSLNIRSQLKIEGVRFEGLTLSSYTPHFDWKYFGLVGSPGLNFGGFSINLTKLELEKQSDEKAALRVAAKFALMGDDMSIGANAGFKINFSYKQNDNKWKFDAPIEVEKICLNMDFSAFRFIGCIEWFDEPTTMYGNGFKGDIEMKIKPISLEIDVHICFGNTNHNKRNVSQPLSQNYKYWYTKVRASGLNIPLFPPMKLTTIIGGAYQQMSNSLCDIKYERNDPNLPRIDFDQEPKYIPDKETAFGFIIGAGANIGDDGLVSIEVMLEMAFNSHCGLRYVTLTGLGTLLSPDIDEGIVRASVFAYYDVENKTFLMDSEVRVDFVGVLTGNARFSIYRDPNIWYCHIGTSTQPNTLSFVGLVKVKSYFMAGAIPDQLPPLSNNILRLFGADAFSDAGGQSSSTLAGNGFAFGISLSADCGFGKNRGFVFAYIDVEGGFDALIDFNRKQCSGHWVDWRGDGRVYAYLDADAGIRVRKKKYSILSLTAATALEAQFPAPYYFSGKIAFRYKILFVKGRISAKYSKGTYC